MGIRQWVDRQITGMGYTKASDRGGVSVSTVLEGEAPRTGPLNVPVMDDEKQRRAERLAITSAWAYSDINLIASEFARASFGVYTQGEESLEEVVAHPFETLLAKPNRFTDHSFLLRYTMTWLQLRGEAYWWLVDDNSGELTEIWHIPSSRMRPIPDKSEYISGYAYQPQSGQKPVIIPPETVCFFRLPNPFDYHRGLSPLSAARLALEADYSAARWNKETFDKEAVLRTLFSLSDKMGKRDYEVRKTELVHELTQERARFLVSRSGDLKAEQFGLNHKDLEFLAGREFLQREVDRIFGVPGGFWAKDATYANAQAAQTTLINSTVYPLHVLIAEAITSQVIIPRYGDNLRGQFEDIRPLDRELLVNERRQYWQVKTVDEARQDLGLVELADAELGGTLVPLATRLQSSTSNAPPFASSPVGSDSRAVREDLRRWQSVELRRLGEGEEPGGYDFVSEHIPASVAANIKALLAGISTSEEVKAVFAATFQDTETDHDHRREDWSAYP